MHKFIGLFCKYYLFLSDFKILINTTAPRMDIKNPGHEISVVVKFLNPLAAQPPKKDPMIPTTISAISPLLSFVIQPATIPVIAPNKIQISKFIFPPPIILYSYYMLNSLYSKLLYKLVSIFIGFRYYK